MRFDTSGEKVSVKDQQNKHPDGDARVCNIEYRPEKLKIISSDQRNPVRPDRIDHRKVEHVDDFSMKRSEEHTSELQSRGHLVCRLLLEKKNKRAARWILHKEHS